ncbi:MULTISPECIES: glucose 1-dehydrogenase [Sphingobium]|uniref:glucose 1-dehydrogenase n=1 Tax=Sphingobium TaxID=165695 RepID=UPI00159C9865|nr:glucose 1-dehydrogenase [Sphingobium sp. 15-1]
MFDLHGKVAIITGGASGIGAAAVRMFQELGASVTIGDIQEEAGNALAQELGDKVRFSRLDVTKPGDWERTVADTEAAFGPVNVLVNNAGHSGHWKPMSEMTLEEYRLVCAINQDGVFLGTKLVLPSMKRAGGGSIVNNSSGYGLVGAANNMDYCASKFAVTGMTKAAAVELAQFKIRVNSVHAGVVLTPMVKSTMAQLGSDADVYIARMPLNRGAQPSEIASVFAFLASEASSFVTGAALPADGGLTAQ